MRKTKIYKTLAEKSVVIEVDGSSHDEKQQDDANRDQYLNSLGLEVIRLQVRDVFQNMSGVVTLFKEPPALTGTPSRGGEYSYYRILFKKGHNIKGDNEK